MEIHIRRVETPDGAIVRMIRLRSLSTDPASFAATHETEAAYSDSDWNDWALGDASGDEMATFLAIDRSNPVGIIACYRDEKQPLTFHVIAMWVAPEARGNGIGRRLLRTVEDWIVAAGGTYVQLSVADRAEAARRLYQTSGYLPHGASADSPHTPGVKHVGLGKNLPRIMRDSRQTAG